MKMLVQNLKTLFNYLKLNLKEQLNSYSNFKLNYLAQYT